MKTILSRKAVVIAVLVVAIVLVGVIYWPKQGQAPAVPTQNVSSTTGSSSSSAAQSSTPSGGGITVTNTFGWNRFSSVDYGMRVDYPKDWIVGSQKPIVINNFNNAYNAQGIIPAGGAEVDIVSTTAGGSVQDIIDTETMRGTSLTTATVSVAGISCKQVSYNATFTGGIASRNIGVYCSGKTLLKIYFVHRANDPKSTELEATFKQILGTIEFTK